MWIIGISAPMALASVAVIGYLFGRRSRPAKARHADARRQLQRAQCVIAELEAISNQVRRSLASHHAMILQFSERVDELGGQSGVAAWKTLSDEARRLARPSEELSREIAHAYDGIRRQAQQLMAFSAVRNDRLTGLGNRRYLDDVLASLLAKRRGSGIGFSVAVFDIDGFARVNRCLGDAQGDQLLKQVADTLEYCSRGTDVVVRYGGDEFVVVLAGTDLSGAASFAERVRQAVNQRLPITISGAVTRACDDDDIDRLMSRVDAALHAAKAIGGNCTWTHNQRHVLRMGAHYQQPASTDRRPAETRAAVSAPVLAPPSPTRQAAQAPGSGGNA